ncbi:MAG: hypothetical protein K0V04_12350 [Deltaproteobacteria bacterium]|nr:hypothetical protein [Deltaproteobacteria bacterium]
MTIEQTLSKLQGSVPECVAVGLVDLNSGMLLGVRTVDSHPQEVLDLVAAATGDLFQGSNVIAIENMFKRIRGVKEDDHHYFQEVVVNSDNLIHVFLRGKKNIDSVLVLVCRGKANLGMVMARARIGLGDVEKAM